MTKNTLDCLPGAFNKLIEEKEFNCTLPWIEGMLGNLKHNSSKNFDCNGTDNFWDVHEFGMKFANRIAKYNHTKCRGNS